MNNINESMWARERSGYKCERVKGSVYAEILTHEETGDKGLMYMGTLICIKKEENKRLQSIQRDDLRACVPQNYGFVVDLLRQFKCLDHTIISGANFDNVEIEFLDGVDFDEEFIGGV